MTLKDRKMDITVRPATVQHPTGKEFTLSVTLWGWETEQLRRIVTEQLPGWLELFARKNSEYGESDASSGTALGQKGQFADIWRKIGKLKTAIWEDRPEQLTTEGVDEIAMDLVGHLFLLLDMRAQTVLKAEPGSLKIVGAPIIREIQSYHFPEPNPADRVVFMDTLPPDTDPALAEVLRGSEGMYTSMGWVDGEKILRAGQEVAFRQHLGKGGVYEVLGFDSRRDYGMVAHVQPVKSIGEDSWTNPDWLEVLV